MILPQGNEQSEPSDTGDSRKALPVFPSAYKGDMALMTSWFLASGSENVREEIMVIWTTEFKGIVYGRPGKLTYTPNVWGNRSQKQGRKGKIYATTWRVPENSKER